MSFAAELISVSWICCAGLLISSLLSNNKKLALWGDIMLAVSFGLMSAVLLHARSFWVGSAFAFPAIRQTYVLVAPRLRRNHC